MPELIYLATPYSHPNPDIRQQRFDLVNRVALRLIRQGYFVYSPITHNHPLAILGELPVGWEYWKEHDYLLLSKCTKLMVLYVDGWMESVGVKAEITYAAKLGIPMEFIDPYLHTDEKILLCEQEFYALSNFSAFQIVWEGRNFPTSEHAYQWEKFHHCNVNSTPERWTIQDRILEAPSAHEALKIAEDNYSLRDSDWMNRRVQTMAQILRDKVAQHEYVKRKLLETGDREIVMNSWEEDEKTLNTLGKLWMEIRREIKDRS